MFLVKLEDHQPDGRMEPPKGDIMKLHEWFWWL